MGRDKSFNRIKTANIKCIMEERYRKLNKNYDFHINNIIEWDQKIRI